MTISQNPISDEAGAWPIPRLSIIVPTYNERANIRALVDSISVALPSIPWEMIVVDDDSPDGTFDEVAAVGAIDPRVRCLRRIGRRGLSSAVIEGALAANAPVVAVMDADFQHDERILPHMFEKIQAGADLVVGTRYAEGGGIGEWDQTRAKMSDFATRMARFLIQNQSSDPMSGFFMITRSAFVSAIYDLSQQGYKILLDILSSSPAPLRVAEVPYTFRARREGESKLSLMVLAEFFFLIVDKLSRGWIPPRFVLFAAVGGLGLFVHLAILFSLKNFHFDFIISQSIATLGAMVFNFAVNNEFTYRDRRLTGANYPLGLALFISTCSLGALANVSVADLAIQHIHSWSIAGIVGALMGSVFNFGIASGVVWRQRRKVIQKLGADPALTVIAEGPATSLDDSATQPEQPATPVRA